MTGNDDIESLPWQLVSKDREACWLCCLNQALHLTSTVYFMLMWVLQSMIDNNQRACRVLVALLVCCEVLLWNCHSTAVPRIHTIKATTNKNYWPTIHTYFNVIRKSKVKVRVSDNADDFLLIMNRKLWACTNFHYILFIQNKKSISTNIALFFSSLFSHSRWLKHDLISGLCQNQQKTMYKC